MENEEKKAGKGLKIVGFILKMLLCMIFILFIAVLATFFISIFLPENVQKAIEIFKNFF